MDIRPHFILALAATMCFSLAAMTYSRTIRVPLEATSEAVMIFTGSGMGSGVVLNLGERTFILTAGHVCGEDVISEVRIQGYGSATAMVEAIDLAHDLCLMAVSDRIESTITLATEMPADGKAWMLSVFPSAGSGPKSPMELTERIYIAQDKMDTDMQCASGAFQPGNSGSPALNAEGQLLGIMSVVLDVPGEHFVWETGCFVPWDVIKIFLDNALKPDDSSNE